MIKENKQLISEEELKWILAIKDNKVEWHYNHYYGEMEDEPSKPTLVTILFHMMRTTGGWTEGIYDVYLSPSIRAVEKKNLYEWLWDAIEAWCIGVTVHWLNEHGPKNWREIADKERSIPEREHAPRKAI